MKHLRSNKRVQDIFVLLWNNRIYKNITCGTLGGGRAAGIEDKEPIHFVMGHRSKPQSNTLPNHMLVHRLQVVQGALFAFAKPTDHDLAYWLRFCQARPFGYHGASAITTQQYLQHTRTSPQFNSRSHAAHSSITCMHAPKELLDDWFPYGKIV
jgi:hypothetical protein